MSSFNPYLPIEIVQNMAKANINDTGQFTPEFLNGICNQTCPFGNDCNESHEILNKQTSAQDKPLSISYEYPVFNLCDAANVVMKIAHNRAGQLESNMKRA